MKAQFVGIVLGALLVVVGMASTSLAVQACSEPNCVQVALGNVTGPAGGTVTVPLTFAQGPGDGSLGGIGGIAAIAMTIGIPGTGTGTPLTLGANCSLNAQGLPDAVKPDTSLSNFNVVVENASCANGRTHCLCPDAGSGITPDDFINLVIYGPNPLPTPNSGGVNIPLLPTGTLLTIDLKIAASAGTSVPLHILNQVTDTQHPQYTALLSVGDKNAVDQTCVPVSGTPPCSNADAVSQVATSDATVTVTAPTCVGDCDSGGTVTVNEIIVLVNIALGSAEPTACAAGIPSGSQVNVALIIQAVNNALDGCPHQ